MLAISWPVRILIALAFVVALFRYALRFYRKRVRRDFVAYLRENYPQIQIVSKHDRYLEIVSPGGGKGSLAPSKLYHACTKAKTDEERLAVFTQFTDAVLKGTEEYAQKLTVEEHGPRLMPRLVRQDALNQMPGMERAPLNPVGDTGLVAVIVLDSEQRVMYLTRHHADELSAGDTVLWELAMANLRKRSSEKLVRSVIDNRNVSMVKLGDSYDAARLLLIPEYLKPGEAVAAVLPDRDTLALVKFPEDGDVTGLRKLARTPDNVQHLLLNRPVKVTSEGIWLT